MAQQARDGDAEQLVEPIPHAPQKDRDGEAGVDDRVGDEHPEKPPRPHATSLSGQKVDEGPPHAEGRGDGSGGSGDVGDLLRHRVAFFRSAAG